MGEEFNLQKVSEEDRIYPIFICEIIRREFARCMKFGVAPGLEDYAIAIEVWIRAGEVPVEG